MTFKDRVHMMMALRSAGLDQWTCSEIQEREQLVGVEASAQEGLVRLRPLFPAEPPRLELPCALAIDAIRAFADARAEARGDDDVDATLDEAQALWIRLRDLAEGTPRSTSASEASR